MFSYVVSLALNDSDTYSENVIFDTAFCIGWPENVQFKRCIIKRYIINSICTACLKPHKMGNKNNKDDTQIKTKQMARLFPAAGLSAMVNYCCHCFSVFCKSFFLYIS